MDEILEILEENARISIEDLARLVKKSKKEVEEAIKKYEKKGIIAKYKTCLLYTSPSPRDISGSRMPSSA